MENKTSPPSSLQSNQSGTSFNSFLTPLSLWQWGTAKTQIRSVCGEREGAASAALRLFVDLQTNVIHGVDFRSMEPQVTRTGDVNPNQTE